MRTAWIAISPSAVRTVPRGSLRNTRYQPFGLTLSAVLDPKHLSIVVLVFDEGQVQERTITMFSSEGRRITSRSAEGVFRSVDDFIGFGDIFVDVMEKIWDHRVVQFWQWFRELSQGQY
jgi:hypothetical protein